jgi:hypothetical protein
MSKKTPDDFKNAIQRSNLDIYSLVAVDNPDLWIPTSVLETLLNQALKDLDLSGLALRTRSKVVKTAVCKALGYPVPKSFKKTQPRFLGQQLDTYAQKNSNLQIWNEELSATRRYAIIQITEHDLVSKIRVVTGQQLALLDTTGTITKKFQARLDVECKTHELVSSQDTELLRPYVQNATTIAQSVSPIDDPEYGVLLPIEEIFGRLSNLIGKSFPDPGIDQERNRGAALHELVCASLGYSKYEDKGQFPDIRHQLLEIKLQTSPTIDLGLILPNSTESLDVQKLGNHQPRHCDARYALFYAKTDGEQVTLTHFFLTTGADFFTRFKRFEGKVSNGKIQMQLPKDFFST